jgi:hypothetical protein
MKFWKNLLLSDQTAAPSPEPAAVNHQLIMSTLHPHYESHVIKWSELSGYDNQQHGLKTCIYIYLYVFERGAGALQGSAPALPPTTTTGGGLRSAGENIIVIMWSRAENECVITKSVRDPTSLTPTWTHPKPYYYCPTYNTQHRRAQSTD